MQCSSCRTTLQPGATTCLACGAVVSAETSDASPYETHADAIPYIPYTPLIERGAVPPNSPAPGISPADDREARPYNDSPALGTPTPQQSFYGVGSLPATPPAAPSAGGYGAQMAAPPFYSQPALSEKRLGVAQPQVFQGSVPPQPLLVQQVPRHGLSVGVTILLIILALLLIGGGSGLTYYATVSYPAELHAQATAVVQNILTQQAQATANVDALTPQELYTQVTNQSPTINDPLSSQAHSIWGSSSNAKLGCDFVGGTYHVRVSPTATANTVDCFAPATDFSDFAFQVQVNIIKGDQGGLIFRADLSTTPIRSYLFAIDQHGLYALVAFQGGGNNNKVVSNGPSSAINTGLNRTNLLTVIARGNKFYLYVNKQFITSVSDSTFKSGTVGLSVSAAQTPTETVFSNAQIWTL